MKCASPRHSCRSANRTSTSTVANNANSAPQAAKAINVLNTGTKYEGFWKGYRENFLYFSRCGMIESVPSRRILSFS